MLRSHSTMRVRSGGFTRRPSAPHRHLVMTAALALAGAALMASPAWSASAAVNGGNVLPATAQPQGWNLAKMTGALALFTTSGNNLAYYPDTPFQVLHYDPGTLQAEIVDGGLHTTGSNTFTVKPGTSFFVPVFNADDSPPVVGTWPATHEQAVGYFFDPAQLGARGLQITVDGKAAPLGPAYLAGPVTTAPLLDGGGTHILTVGAFLSPLTPGRHTVSVNGGLFGSDISNTYGLTFIDEDISYTVTVRP